MRRGLTPALGFCYEIFFAIHDVGSASCLGNIVSGQVAPFYADMLIARPIVAQPGVFRAGRLQLERSQDGIWRITSM